MSNGFMHKVKSWVSGDPFEDDVFSFEDEEYGHESSRQYQTMRPDFEVPEDPKRVQQQHAAPQRNLKVVGRPNSSTASGMQQVVVIEPRAFEEALDIIDYLRAKKSVLLNLHLLDNSQSQRVVDFLSGATHAIEGNQQRIGDVVFMFTPSSVMITSEALKASTMAAPTSAPHAVPAPTPMATTASTTSESAFWTQQAR